MLLTLPYSFSQLGMVSGIVLQVFYGLMGSWTAYLISVLYIEYRSRKEKEGASFKNHVIQVRINKKQLTQYDLIPRIARAYCFHFIGSGLKCLMDYWVLTGKQQALPSTVRSFCLDLSYN